MVTLTGCQRQDLAPTADREFIYAFLVQIFCYLYTIYNISVLASMTSATGEVKQKQDILVDNYLEIIDSLGLDPQLKFTVRIAFSNST